MILVGNVEGKTAILIDDIVDTCGTIDKAARLLIEKGASRCVALVSHAFLSGEAIDVVQKSPLSEIIVANTVPLHKEAETCKKIRTMDVSGILAEAIRGNHHGES